MSSQVVQTNAFFAHVRLGVTAYGSIDARDSPTLERCGSINLPAACQTLTRTCLTVDPPQFAIVYQGMVAI